ncbi:MAG: carbohydrate ABC transporter permease [Chloroflexi bacterium]|nr:MAG: carbohydrate ABC transporter permease [Chloroflexota bacterium]
MSAWLPPRARSRRWSVSSWSFSRIGWCAAPSRKVQSSSPVVVLPTKPPRLRAGYRRVRPGQIAIHASLLLLSFLFLFPLVLLVSASLSSETDIYVLQEPSQILTAYAVTITVTAIGTAAGVLVMALLAYPLSRPDFSWRRPLSFVVFFTLLFSGGLVPLYILVTHYLQINNTLWALILPYLVMPWYVFLLRAYFAGLPRELIDAAKVDGAGEWRIFFQIVVPLSRPALATIALFCALTYWNDWYLALLFINNPALVPLQYLLYQISTNIQTLQTSSQAFGVTIPALSAQMAIAVLAIGPITLAFLAVQKHFVSGITLGGVKGD